MLSLLAIYFGIDTLHSHLQGIIYKYTLVKMLSIGFWGLSSTFLILYYLDLVESFYVVGIILSIELLTQMIFDYHSGAFRDWIGQKWVLIISYSGFDIVFLIIASFPSFYGIILGASIIGFATAQFSGSLET